MYYPEAKQSDTYGHKLLPPDFTRHTVRSGSKDGVTARDLFRTIASGIGGTAMPMWKGSISDDKIWAIAYFVKSKMDMFGKADAQAEAERNKLVSQPEFVPPPPPAEEGAEEGAEAPAAP